MQGLEAPQIHLEWKQEGIWLKNGNLIIWIEHRIGLGASPTCRVCQGIAAARDNRSSFAWLLLPTISWSAYSNDTSLAIGEEECKGR